MLQAEDEDEAMEAVDKAAEGEARDAEYEGVDLKRLPGGISAGVLDGWLVIGSRRGFELAVHASKGERSLEDSDQYSESTDDMEDDPLGFVYFDARAIIGAVPNGTRRLGAVANLLLRPFVITFDADAEGVEVAATVPEALGEALGILVGKGSKLMDDAPADAWFAAGSSDLGESLKTVLDVASQEIGGRAVLGRRLHRATGLDLERDLLDWMGDAAYFVRGPSATTLSGAVVIESTDVNASYRALAAVGPLLRPPSRFPREPVTAPGGGNGFTVRVRELPEPVHYFERDGKVVVAYGNDAVRHVFEPSETLRESSAYRDAAESLGDGYDVSTYVRLGPIVRLLDSTPLADDDGWQQAKPYLEPLLALVAGAKKDGEDITARFRLTVD
jgi:Protein of unknown function (DUF3352)